MILCRPPARFLWGAASSVEEIDSSMVCLTGLTLFRRVRRPSSARPSAHAPRRRAQFLLHSLCSGCTCPERCCEGVPKSVLTSLSENENESPTNTQSHASWLGQTGCHAAPSAAPANSAPGWNAIGAASAHHSAFGRLWK